MVAMTEKPELNPLPKLAIDVATSAVLRRVVAV
jgi:hypothetical protein